MSSDWPSNGLYKNVSLQNPVKDHCFHLLSHLWSRAAQVICPVEWPQCGVVWLCLREQRQAEQLRQTQSAGWACRWYFWVWSLGAGGFYQVSPPGSQRYLFPFVKWKWPLRWCFGTMWLSCFPISHRWFETPSGSLTWILHWWLQNNFLTLWSYLEFLAGTVPLRRAFSSSPSDFPSLSFWGCHLQCLPTHGCAYSTHPQLTLPLPLPKVIWG